MTSTLISNRKNHNSPFMKSHRFLQLVDLAEMLGVDVSTFRESMANANDTKIWIDGYTAKKWGRTIRKALSEQRVRNVTFPCEHWVGEQEKANLFAPVEKTTNDARIDELFEKYVFSSDHKHIYMGAGGVWTPIAHGDITITEPLSTTQKIMKDHACFMIDSGGFWLEW